MSTHKEEGLIPLENTQTGTLVLMTLSGILEEINRDRNEEWEDYNGSEWMEGLTFTEYKLLEKQRG